MTLQRESSLRGLRLSDHTLRGRASSLHSSRHPTVAIMKVRRSQLLRIVFIASVLWLLFINHKVLRRNADTTRQALSVGDAPWMTENITASKPRKKKNSAKKTKSKTNEPVVETDFDWTDIDLTKKGNCGWHKCFWRSVSNQTVGYLLAEERQYRQMKHAVDVALDLEKNFKSKHFHLDLVVVNVTEKFKDRLNDLVDQPARRARGLPNQGIYRSRQLIIERVIIAPDPALFFGSAKANRQLTEDQVPEFRSKIPDKHAFREQINTEHERLQKVFNHNPLLALDFQAVIDPAGHLYHIDLDGHLSMAKRENNTDLRVAECLAFLEEVNDHLTLPDKADKVNKAK